MFPVVWSTERKKQQKKQILFFYDSLVKKSYFNRLFLVTWNSNVISVKK